MEAEGEFCAKAAPGVTMVATARNMVRRAFILSRSLPAL